MNWRHLQAFVWLRWRLMTNQWRRAGAFNAVLMIVVSVAAVVTAIPMFIGGFALAVYAIPKAEPTHLMYAWDGLIFAFLLFWGVGLITELQRNDPLSLSKFLHLPVTVGEAFLINYVSSLLRLSLLFFGPLMVAYALALVYVKGWSQLLVLPSLAAFLLMITALTYQFQGWLASLMSNPRRRRTVIVAITAGFVLIFQLPNLLNLYAPWGAQGAQGRADRSNALVADLVKLEHAFKAKEYDAVEYQRRSNELIAKNKADSARDFREGAERFERGGRLVNTVLPVGWLPLGVAAAAEGRVTPSLLGLLGMTLLGAGSLWRAYRTTINLYQGRSTSRKVRAPIARADVDRKPDGRGRLLEARLPGLSEPVSAIALGGFRSMLRSPEAKMALMTPLIMGGVFGAMLFKGRDAVPESLRPLLAIAAIVFVLFGLLQLMGNQFGIDRDGFRVFVLCAAPRREVLLGKNMSFVPAALALSAIMLTAVEVLCPMRLDHLLAMIPQFASMFLLF